MNLRFYFSSCHNLIQVVIARGFHLFPFRTEKLSLVTPMVLRNSGRVGSRRFFQREALVSEDAGAFLFLDYFVCLALYLPCFACFVLFCLFSWGQQIFSGDYFYTCEVSFFLCFQDIISYHIISYPYHIIYLASISSYVFLFLCLKEMLCIRLFAPFICLFSGFTLYFFFPCYLIVIFTEQNW